MTSQTIGQFGFRNGIIFVTSAMAVQTPTHVHCLRHGGDHLADLSVAILTIDTGCNMGTVAEGNKIWQNSHRHPGNGLVFLYITCQYAQLEAGLGVGAGFGNLLVAGGA
jgi:hypothetical protein